MSGAREATATAPFQAHTMTFAGSNNRAFGAGET